MQMILGLCHVFLSQKTSAEMSGYKHKPITAHSLLNSGATYLWISKVLVKTYITCLRNKLTEIQTMLHVDDTFYTCKSTTWPFLDNTGHLRGVP